MKHLFHDPRNTNICIYKYSNGFIKGSFFKEKPEVGDSIQSVFFGVVYISAILSIRDAQIQSECTHDPIMAYYELEVSNKLF